VNGVLAAEPAVFIHFQPVGIIFFVFCRVVISLLAIVTPEGYFNSHRGTSLNQVTECHFASLSVLAESGSC